LDKEMVWNFAVGELRKWFEGKISQPQLCESLNYWRDRYDHAEK